MTGFNHGMTGAVVALAVKQPELAIPLAFLSHFAQDAIPHWDYGTGQPNGSLFSKQFNIFLVSDFVFSVGLMVVICLAFPAHAWLVAACMVAAASPDLVWGYYYLYEQRIKNRKIKLNWLAKLHDRIEWSESLPGAAIECLWLILFSLLVIKLR